MAEEVATALLVLWNDVTPDQDARYNAWHAHEHVPQRLTVPGILWAWRCGLEQPGAAPRYLTLYGLRDAEVLDDARYQALLYEPTPWSREMRPALLNITRWVCTLDAQSALPAPPARLAVWTGSRAKMGGVWAPAAEADARGRLLARRLPDARPLPWLTTHARDGRGGIDGDMLACTAHDAAAAATPVGQANCSIYQLLSVH